jgi:hypothetical protein
MPAFILKMNRRCMQLPIGSACKGQRENISSMKQASVTFEHHKNVQKVMLYAAGGTKTVQKVML